MQLISIIAAYANYRVIGNNNQLPWHLSADLKHFKQLTLGKSVIMGRKTHESIGKALPQRKNIVISRNKQFVAPGCLTAASLSEALVLAGDEQEIIIMGGAQIYEQSLSVANRMYLTLIHADFPGDAFFPAWNEEEWQETHREDIPADNFNYSFVTLERN